MTAKHAFLMRVLINRYHKGSPEPLLRFLPEPLAEEVRHQESNSSEFSPLLVPSAEMLGRVHYSWLIPIVQKLPARAQASLLRALPAKQAKPLSRHLKIDLHGEPLAPVLQTFMVRLAHQNLPDSKNILPIEYLPPTPLSTLAGYNKQELVELVNYLGIHDLAEEIRSVVDTRKLKGVYSCLSVKEQQYLKYCMHLKEKFSAPSLGLEKWGGDCNKMKAALQVRGLIRLGKALSGEHPDLIWHIAHILDTGRGVALSKYYAKKPVGGLTPALANQVTTLIGILKKKSNA